MRPLTLIIWVGFIWLFLQTAPHGMQCVPGSLSRPRTEPGFEASVPCVEVGMARTFLHSNITLLAWIWDCSPTGTLPPNGLETSLTQLGIIIILGIILLICMTMFILVCVVCCIITRKKSKQKMFKGTAIVVVAWAIYITLAKNDPGAQQNSCHQAKSVPRIFSTYRRV